MRALDVLLCHFPPFFYESEPLPGLGSWWFSAWAGNQPQQPYRTGVVDTEYVEILTWKLDPSAGPYGFLTNELSLQSPDFYFLSSRLTQFNCFSGILACIFYYKFKSKMSKTWNEIWASLSFKGPLSQIWNHDPSNITAKDLIIKVRLNWSTQQTAHNAGNTTRQFFVPFFF